MKTISPALAAHLQGETVTLARLWKITRKTTLAPNVAPGQPSLSIAPVHAFAAPSTTFQFTATLVNASGALNWFVDGVLGGNVTVGTITSGGLYSAPSTNGDHTITASLATDMTVTASVTITVAPPPPTVAVNPASVTVAPSGTQAFTATVLNSPGGTSVTWYVDNVAGGNGTVGTISGVGLYTAPATNGTHTVKAVLDADHTVFDTSPVKVGTGSPPLANGVIPNTYISVCAIGPGQGWGTFPNYGNLYSDRLWDAGMDYFLTAGSPFITFQGEVNKWISKLRLSRIDKLTGASYKPSAIVTLCGRGAWAAYAGGGVWSSTFLTNIWTRFIDSLCAYYGAGCPGDATDVIEAFEIWNEPDAGNNTGIPSGVGAQCVSNWIALAAIAAPRLRAAGFKPTGACPQSGQHGSDSFLYELGRQGGGVHLDAISRHHYRDLPETTAQYLQSEIKACQTWSNLAGKEWWVTEANSTSHSEIGEDAAVAYVQRLYILCWALGSYQSVQLLTRLYFWTYDSQDPAPSGMPILLCNNSGDSFYPSAPRGGENVVAKAWGTVSGHTTSGKAYSALQSKLVGAKLTSYSVDSLQNWTVHITYANGTTGTITWCGKDLTNANAIPTFA